MTMTKLCPSMCYTSQQLAKMCEIQLRSQRCLCIHTGFLEKEHYFLQSHSYPLKQTNKKKY